jgi:hypothetical protein
VGKVAGVDAIVTGSITDLQSYVALNCRLIDAQTGRIFGAAQTKIVKDDDVRKIMGAALPSSEGEGSRAPAPRSEPSAGAAPKGIPPQRVENFVFDLKRCTLSGTSIDCDSLITNQGNDRALAYDARSSRLIDEEGGEYHATSVTLGGGAFGSVDGFSRERRAQRDDSSRTRTTLPSGVPVKARLTFEGIPPETKRAALVELRDRDVIVQFRNVSLVRP